MRVDIWSDYVCPWCYLGTQVAEWLEHERGCRVVWHPFEGHPEIPLGRAARAPRLGGRVDRLMADAGLPYQQPDRVVNTHAALEVGELARDQGVFREWHRRAFLAHFVHGLDLSDEAVLRAVGEESGIDPDDVSDAVAAGRFAEKVDTARQRALDRGIGGAPGFLFDRRLVVPAVQRREVFERILDRLQARS